MSYDIYLECTPCPTCGKCGDNPNLPNPTYNLTPIFDLALTSEPLPNPELSEAQVVLFHEATLRPRGLRVLSGKMALETLKQLREAVDFCEDAENQKELHKLEPDNGWGTLEDAILVLNKLIKAATDYPNYIWNIH